MGIENIRGLDDVFDNYKKNKQVICKKCNKPIKENTGGILKYCQGHGIFEESKEIRRNI